jgi:hypothetical protein
MGSKRLSGRRRRPHEDWAGAGGGHVRPGAKTARIPGCQEIRKLLGHQELGKKTGKPVNHRFQQEYGPSLTCGALASCNILEKFLYVHFQVFFLIIQAKKSSFLSNNTKNCVLLPGCHPEFGPFFVG